MKLRWAQLVCVLAFSMVVPGTLAAQSGQPGRKQAPKLELGQNYPNPMNPETSIQFRIPCEESDVGRTRRTTLRIYNILTQLVAIPVLQGATATVAGGQPLEKLPLACGEYVAYWDGKYRNSDREAASGIYMYRLEVEGFAPIVRKMTVAK